MNTADGINLCLKVIGESGLSIVSLPVKSSNLAVAMLLEKSGLKLSKDKCQLIAKELKRQGLVDISVVDGEIKLNLTPAGVHRLLYSEINQIKINMPKKWDGIWRMVSYDVPLRFTKERAAFVSKLHEHGFMMLQKGVWVHPSNCLSKIQKITNYYNITRYCSFAEIDAIDQSSARKLLNYFKFEK